MTTATEDFPRLLDLALAEATEETSKTVEAHALKELAGWTLFEERARLLFADANQRYAMMAAQIIGLYEPAKKHWQWGWNEPTFPAHITQAAIHVKRWGELNGIQLLTEPTATIDEGTAWRLAAFAARYIGWPGIYRGVGGPSVIYLAFAPTTQPKGGPDTVTTVTSFPPPKLP